MVLWELSINVIVLAELGSLLFCISCFLICLSKASILDLEVYLFLDVELGFLLILLVKFW